MKEQERYENLSLYLKTLSMREAFSILIWRQYAWAALILLLVDLAVGTRLPFYAALPIIAVTPVVVFLAAALRVRFQPTRQAFPIALERFMPRVVRHMLARGELERRLGESLASRLDNIAASAREAIVALAQISLQGTRLPPTYKSTIKECGAAVELTFRRVLATLQNPLLFRVPMTPESLAALAQEEQRLLALSLEAKAFSASMSRSPDMKTDQLIERLRTLQEVERSISENADQTHSP